MSYLSHVTKLRIARQYQLGETSTSLAKRYGVRPERVRTIFQRSGLAMRRGSRPRSGKTAALAAIMAAEPGLTAVEMAHRVECSHQLACNVARSVGYKLYRGRRPGEAHKALLPHATARGVTVAELKRRIIEAVAHGDLVNAVLDDMVLA